jgi:uncharacterized protein YfdQ (DUF2303 family)
MMATTVLDMGTTLKPGHQKHTAALALRETVEYKEFKRFVSVPRSQRETCDFLDDWAELITAHSSDGDIINAHQASARFRTLTIEKARETGGAITDFSESKSLSERIEALQSETIPARITFTCRPCMEMDEIDFECRVSILTTSDEPQIRLRIIRFESHFDSIRKVFAKMVSDLLTKQKIPAFIGGI